MLHLKHPLYSMFALILIALTSQSSATPLDIAEETTGMIYFYNDKNEEACTLPVPATSQYFNFGNSNERCENNMVSTFWLKNIPSATLIHFYESESCTDAPSKDNFYIKFKTVKTPTDWSENNPAAITIDSMRNLPTGGLLPKRNIRLEASFVGAEFNNKSLNEQLSCVYIERSQPVD